ncbi:hypothetical protein ACFLX2_00360 [Candidatus Dependentiae bacterium]
MAQVVEGRLKQSGSVSGMTKPGIGLIELLLAIALLGVMAAIVIPNLGTGGAREQREQFITDLNLITKFAWQKAVVTNKIHKIEFDMGMRQVTVMQASKKIDAEGKPTFEPIQHSYMNTKIKIPSQLIFRNFYVETFDEMARYGAGKRTDAVWFYVVPEGLSQSVIINIVDIKDKVAGRGKTIGLVLNPFSAQFGVYDEFKKPE